jgi:hypothetical protein
MEDKDKDDSVVYLRWDCRFCCALSFTHCYRTEASISMPSQVHPTINTRGKSNASKWWHRNPAIPRLNPLPSVAYNDGSNFEVNLTNEIKHKRRETEESSWQASNTHSNLLQAVVTDTLGCARFKHIIPLEAIAHDDFTVLQFHCNRPVLTPL